MFLSVKLFSCNYITSAFRDEEVEVLEEVEGKEVGDGSVPFKTVGKWVLFSR